MTQYNIAVNKTLTVMAAKNTHARAYHI